jgi:hypothetical protein
MQLQEPFVYAAVGRCGGFPCIGDFNRDRGVDERAITVRMYVELSAHLAQSFLHTTQSYAAEFARGQAGLRVRWDTFPGVTNFEANFFVGARNTNCSGAAAGVAVNVGEALLHNSKQSDFEVTREPPKIIGQFQVDIDFAPFAEAIDIPLEGGLQTDFVKQRRVQQVRNGADLARELS